MNAEFSINGRKIETKRLLLRPFAESDLDDFFEYASVEGVGEMAGWHHHESKEESRAILERFIDEELNYTSNITSGKIYSSVIEKERGRSLDPQMVSLLRRHILRLPPHRL